MDKAFKYNRLAKDNAALLVVDHQAGLISLVQDFPPNEFKNNVLALARLTVRGFILDDYRARFSEAVESLAAWMQSGHLTTRQDIRQGLENAVSSLQDIYSGRNFGKLLLEVTR